MIDDAVGLVPAAGRGVRLGLPYPKELYPIIRENRYKPVSQFVLDNLIASGVGHVVFVINETKHQLVGYFGDGSRFGCDMSYVVQEDRRAERAIDVARARARPRCRLPPRAGQDGLLRHGRHHHGARRRVCAGVGRGGGGR